MFVIFLKSIELKFTPNFVSSLDIHLDQDDIKLPNNGWFGHKCNIWRTHQSWSNRGSEETFEIRKCSAMR